MIDYINELREACLEAYTGIIQGLKGDDEKAVSRKYSIQFFDNFLINMVCDSVFFPYIFSADVEIMKPHIAHIVSFLELIAEDPEKSEGAITCASGLIG